LTTQLEVVLTDLSNKIPYLRQVFRPEYAPYLNTIAAILLGWLFVSWIFHLIWILFTPLILSAIAIALMCPSTSKWCFQQLAINLEEIMNDFIHKFQTSR
ncbi:uncharacterized protein LOC113562210, partial [Ooceraea biroi]|uniref:uncharacterized protein LOC113562210 n=1 Tax=Ooceraea biroi TaxID=2015173 RepID=UPI000F07BB15